MVRGATQAETRVAWGNVISMTTTTGGANGKAGDAREGCHCPLARSTGEKALSTTHPAVARAGR